MPSPEAIQKIAENLDQMQLGLDDAFRFKCHGCGKCCKNRDDILLTSRDLFRLAVFMKMTPMQVIGHCCEVYIGSQTGLPIVRLEPVGPNKVCPLLKDNRCSVHASKPVVCALFPLGRFQKPSTLDPTKPGESGYILWPTSCGGRTVNTVRSYLESFDIPLEDAFQPLWNGMLLFLTDFTIDALRAGIAPDVLAVLRRAIIEVLYLRYDTEADFLLQFRENAAILKAHFAEIRRKAFPKQ